MVEHQLKTNSFFFNLLHFKTVQKGLLYKNTSSQQQWVLRYQEQQETIFWQLKSYSELYFVFYRLPSVEIRTGETYLPPEKMNHNQFNFTRQQVRPQKSTQLISELTKFFPVERPGSSTEQSSEEALLGRLRHVSRQEQLAQHLVQTVTGTRCQKTCYYHYNYRTILQIQLMTILTKTLHLL